MNDEIKLVFIVVDKNNKIISCHKNESLAISIAEKNGFFYYKFVLEE